MKVYNKKDLFKKSWTIVDIALILNPFVHNASLFLKFSGGKEGVDLERIGWKFAIIFPNIPILYPFFQENKHKSMKLSYKYPQNIEKKRSRMEDLKIFYTLF